MPEILENVFGLQIHEISEKESDSRKEKRTENKGFYMYKLKQ